MQKLENSSLHYRQSWVTKLQQIAEFRYTHLVTGIAGNLSMEERRVHWDELKKNSRWNILFGDLIPNAIAVGSRKVLFIINCSNQDPVCVVTPEEFGEERDEENPLVMVYDGNHYEHLIPATEQDERKIIEQVGVYSHRIV